MIVVELSEREARALAQTADLVADTVGHLVDAPGETPALKAGAAKLAEALAHAGAEV